jgi:beta-RFAP synthase
VRTGSRLHLGLLSLPADGERWPDRNGTPRFVARRYGGVGLMLDAPGIVLRAEPAKEWVAEGPLAGRVVAFARRVLASAGEADLVPLRFVVESAAREHVGLGAGTQLALAVAKAIAASAGIERSAAEMARLVGRGGRSALGVHGFAQGGFLVEAGKPSGRDLSPLVARMDWPADWQVVAAVPEAPPGRHGGDEKAAFERLSASAADSEALCRLVLLGMLPALAEGDLEAFGEAVFDFNARVGEWFAPEQGGTYASAPVAEFVEFFRRQGVRGAGQSSWGPGVFAFVGDEEAARDLARRAQAFFPTAEVWVARGVNHGATVESR